MSNSDSNSKFDNYNGYGIILALFLVAMFFVYRNTKIKELANPRDKNGIYYIQTNDSIYKLKFEIDSVFPIEYDPPERN